MKPFIRAATSTSLAAATLAMFGTGLASAAPSVVGMTYDKAQSAVQGAGLTAEVATSIGTALQQGDCIVTSQVVRPALHFGQQDTPSTVMVSLNCNAVVADAAHPGNSAASPQARAAKEERESEAWKATPEGEAWCKQAARLHPDWVPVQGCPT